MTRATLTDAERARVDDSDHEGLAPTGQLLREAAWLEKLMMLLLNNLEAVVDDRLKAVAAVATELRAIRTRSGIAAEEVRGVMQVAADKVMSLLVAYRTFIEKRLREMQVLPPAAVAVTASEQHNLLAHISTEDFETITPFLDIQWMRQLMVTRSMW